MTWRHEFFKPLSGFHHDISFVWHFFFYQKDVCDNTTVENFTISHFGTCAYGRLRYKQIHWYLIDSNFMPGVQQVKILSGRVRSWTGGSKSGGIYFHFQYRVELMNSVSSENGPSCTHKLAFLFPQLVAYSLISLFLWLTLFAYQSDVDLSQEDILIQEFISDQLLIYGRTFNTGIRTLITSLKPLRAYYIGSDFSHRVSDEQYNASDLRNTATYVTDRRHRKYSLRQVNV